ncbi:MAG: mechanosensitive ion channel family protein [Gammaproteobacteria bacterium]
MKEELEVVQRIYGGIVDFLVNYSFQIVGAIIILIAGILVARSVAKAVLRVLEHRDVDVTLRQFIASTVRLIIIVMFVMIAMGKLGISITPLIAALGGLAVGASFAIQGPVSNYGAGFVIILTRMFKVGDTISVQGCSGVVSEITLATTQLVAEDGEDIVIPNKHVVGEIHRNSYESKVVEGSIGIAYQESPKQAIAVIEKVINEHANTGDNPRAVVGIEAFGDSSINIAYRYWAPTMKFFETQYAINLAVFDALAEAGINIPFPQREVRILES